MRNVLLMAIFIGLAGCGKGGADLPQAATLQTDRDSLGFGQENGSGTYVGTTGRNSLQIENQGLDDLVIQSVDLSGDDAFSMEGPDVTTVISGTSALVTLYFTPSHAGTFTGKLTITSNDAHSPKEVTLSGLGIDPPDGGT